MNQRRSLAGWLSAAGIVPLLAIGIASLPLSSTIGQTTYTVYNAPANSIPGSEELDLVLGASGKFAIVVGANESTQRRVRTVPLTVPPTVSPGSFLISNATDTGQYPGLFPALDPGGSGRPVTPVVSNIASAPNGSYVIVTLRDSTAANATPGKAVFLDVNPATGALAKRLIGTADNAVTLGIFPSSVEIAANGNYAVIANSDERGVEDGSIQIVDLRAGATQYQVVNTITPVVPPGSLDLGTGAQPETMAINAGSTRAYATLQPNNAVTIVDIDPTTLAATATTLAVGTRPATGLRLHPDGVDVTTQGGTDYLVTADEGFSGTIPPAPGTPYNVRANSVSMFRVDAGPALALVNNQVLPTAGANPAKVEIGTIGGALQAAVSESGTSAPGKLALLPVATAGLGTPLEVNLVDSNAANTAANPTGVAIANGIAVGGSNGDVVVTANRTSRNVSVVFAGPAASPSASATPSASASATPSASASATPSASASPSPSPSTPGGTLRTFLPLAQK